MRSIRGAIAVVIVSSVVALSGSGTAQADGGTPGIGLSPSSADFGEVPVQSPYGGGPPTVWTTHTFTVTSAGTVDLVVDRPTVTGTDSGQFSISRNTCTSPLAPGGACEIEVTVVPWFDMGPQSATLVVSSNAPDGPRTAAMTATIVPRIVTTKLTADPVSMRLGPLGALRLFPRATLTDSEAYPLPLLGWGDTGREVVFTVNGETVCRAIASPWNGVASCQGLVPFLAVLRAGGYDAHFEEFSYSGYQFLPSTAHGPLIG
jgi:hypothetical protein